MLHFGFHGDYCVKKLQSLTEIFIIFLLRMKHITANSVSVKKPKQQQRITEAVKINCEIIE